MKIKINLFLLLIFLSNTLLAQITKVVKGHIMSENKPVIGIQIINLTSEKSKTSDSNGFFTIAAQTDDLLVMSSINYNYCRKIIDEKDFNQQVIITLEKKIEQLDEVIVENNSITTENLGIVNKNIKKYTPAERQLKSATDWNFVAVSMSLDPLLNYLSGRTNTLKRALETEKKELHLGKLNFLISDEYYIKTLQIEPNQVMAFKYFLIENTAFKTQMQSKNIQKLKFTMVELAIQYKQLLQSNPSK